MYEKPHVNIKVEPRSTFMFTSDLPYIVSNLFTHVKPVKVYVRTHVKIMRQWKSTLRLKLSRNKLYVVNELSAVMLSALFFVSFSFVTVRGHFSPQSP